MRCRPVAIRAACARRLRARHLERARLVRVGIAVWLGRDGVSGRGRVPLLCQWHASCSALVIVQVDPGARTSSTTSSMQNRRKRLLLLSITLGLIGFVAAAIGIFVANVPLSSDVLRHRIIETLSDKLDSDVELGDLQLRVYPALRAEGTNLRIRRRGAAADLPPLISVKSFHVDGNLLRIWRKHVDHVHVVGLDITVPPKSERTQQKKIREETPRPQATAGPTGTPPKPTDQPETPAERKRDPLKDGGVVIDRIDTDDARLIIVPEDAGRQPRDWAIHHLTMHRLGPPQP